MAKDTFIYGIHAVSMALQVYPAKIKKLILLSNRQDERIQAIVDLASEHGISIETSSRKNLTALLGHEHHQGVVAVSQQAFQYGESDIPNIIAASSNEPLLLILDGVQDPHNLGACLRSANAFGVDAVIVPKNRAVGLTPTARKVACGAAEITPLIQVTNLARCLRNLQDQGIWLVGTADDEETRLSQVDLSGPIGIVMGNEGQGMRQLTRKHCDFIAQIPMQGAISSLNVSVATGVCLYEVQRQRYT